MKAILVSILVIGVTANALALQSKENDLDVISVEERVPSYNLPPLLLSSSGKAITTIDEWIHIRRPEVLALFENLVYGQVPNPRYPVQTSYRVIQEVPDFMDGLATRLSVIMQFSNPRGSVQSLVQIYIPNNTTGPVPAALILGFNETDSADFNADSAHPGMIKAGWPVALVLNNGFALVAIDHTDLVDHNEVTFGDDTIQQLFYADRQSFPRAYEWGVIGAIAWGASRALDYLQTLERIDATRVAIMGHSKLGKAALWAAAQDQRFALVVAAQSGAGGAALWRRKAGETLNKMVTRFPYWLSRNAWKFVGNENDLPVDQHMLLALIAPRPLYIASGQDDHWADPRGEYLSAFYAGDVYRLFGLKGLESEQSPPLNQALTTGSVAYHIRSGGHSVEAYDWNQFMAFLNQHLLKDQ
jgi:hypothetical protein